MEIDLFCELASPPIRADRRPHPYDELFTIVRAADELGFGALWLPEHHFLGSYSAAAAPDMLLAAVARETERMKLGFAILPLPIHDPVRIAERLATLDVVSGGRVMWGVGRGITKTELGGFGVAPESTRQALKQRIAELRQILEDGRFSRDGATYELNPQSRALHDQGWMAAVSPESFELAAELELDVLTGPFKPWPMIKSDLKRYRRLRPGGKTSYTIALYCEPNHEHARRRAGPGILWAYRRILDIARPMLARQVVGYEHYRKLGWMAPLLEKTLTLGVMEAMGLAVVGGPDHVAHELGKLSVAGLDRVSLVLGGGDLTAAETTACLELLSNEVLPSVRAAAPANIRVPA